uniref:Dynein light chain Tctex-type 1 n=1 Tax=Cyprinus carpio TaxID=7962 RepID=A0A8C1XLQ7_CYPCA
MDEDQPAEETTFVVDEITTVIKEAVESTIGNSSYQHSQINQWMSSIVESSLSQLTKLGKPFKYIVTCIILQKNGAGLHTASSCFWDNSTDGKTYCKTGQAFHISFFFFNAKRTKSKHNREIAFNETDFCFSTGSCKVRWENKTIYCIVSVFGLAI